MASAQAALQQQLRQAVLWEGTLQRQQYGELVQDVSSFSGSIVTCQHLTPAHVQPKSLAAAAHNSLHQAAQQSCDCPPYRSPLHSQWL
jgi:DNA-binding transcriptional regulator YdaS (Cro superfamily)